MESTDSPSQHPQLPPGFRFHPTDEELVVHYLKRKADAVPLPVAIIAEVDLYKFDPWELPAKAAFGEQEWYFFSPRDRKYPNGARPNRAATSGYWKATGTDKPVVTSGAGGTHKVGVKKALVFYGGKPPKGVKTNWIMHEYRITDNAKPPACDLANKKGSLRLDDWVLCRIYKKNNTQPRPMEHESMNDDMLASIPIPVGQQNPTVKPSTYAALLQNQHNMFDGGITTKDHAADLSHHHQFASKHSLQTLFWNHEGTAASSSSTKRFLADHNDDVATTNDNGSIATLVGQQAMMGSLGHGVPYDLPNNNWYSY